MTKFIKTLLLPLCLTLALPACDSETVDPDAAQQATSQGAEAKPLFINMTSDLRSDPHSLMMGLHLAQKALRNGLPATVFLNVHGVKLFAPGAEALSFREENFHATIRQILDAGGRVLVCPHCAMVHGIQEQSFMPGAQLGTEALLMGALKQDPIVFTY